MYRLFESFVYQFSGNPIFSTFFFSKLTKAHIRSRLKHSNFFFPEVGLEISGLQSIFN